MGKTEVSAPGKLILMGEHAAVYGRPALIAALGLRMHARFEDGRNATHGESDAVALQLPDVGMSLVVSWQEILDITAKQRQAWERYSDDPGPGTFRSLRGGGAERHVIVALGETAAVLGAEQPSRRQLTVTVRSEIPTGAGFGSSAAAAVVVVAGLLAHAGAEASHGLVENLALEVERRQHGSPSGVDSGTVIRGGVVRAQRRDSALALELLEHPGRLLGRLRVYNTGRPAQTTGTVVAAVRERRDRDPAQFEAILDRMQDATLVFREQLQAENEDPEEVIDAVREYQACLAEIGVVPARVRGIVREIEAIGGAAKISGAGALGGPGAGCLLVYLPQAAAGDTQPPGPTGGAQPPESAPDDLQAVAGVERIDASLGTQGLRREVT